VSIFQPFLLPELMSSISSGAASFALVIICVENAGGQKEYDKAFSATRIPRSQIEHLGNTTDAANG
jgi:hypothetical protein